MGGGRELPEVFGGSRAHCWWHLAQSCRGAPGPPWWLYLGGREEPGSEPGPPQPRPAPRPHSPTLFLFLCFWATPSRPRGCPRPGAGETAELGIEPGPPAREACARAHWASPHQLSFQRHPGEQQSREPNGPPRPVAGTLRVFSMRGRRLKYSDPPRPQRGKGAPYWLVPGTVLFCVRLRERPCSPVPGRQALRKSPRD